MNDFKANLTFQDKVLKCVDCGQSFIFTVGEQGFYYSKELSKPKRCKPCRDFRRRTILPREVRNGYRQIRVSFEVEGDASSEQLAELVEQSRARSAVYDVLVNGTDVVLDVTTP